MIRKTVYESVGDYDRRQTNLLDLDMWIRILVSGFNIYVLDEELTAFRIRDAGKNLSTPRRWDVLYRTQFEWAQILKHFTNLEPDTFRQTFEKELEARGLKDDASQARALSHLALDTPRAAHRLFALHTLYDHASQPEDYQLLRDLTGEVDVFGLSNFDARAWWRWAMQTGQNISRKVKGE